MIYLHNVCYVVRIWASEPVIFRLKLHSHMLCSTSCALLRLMMLNVGNVGFWDGDLRTTLTFQIVMLYVVWNSAAGDHQTLVSLPPVYRKTSPFLQPVITTLIYLSDCYVSRHVSFWGGDLRTRFTYPTVMLYVTASDNLIWFTLLTVYRTSYALLWPLIIKLDLLSCM